MRNAQAPIGTIRPVVSASGTKSDGRTTRPSRRQRSKASNPATAPVASSTTGWCRSSSPTPSRASRRSASNAARSAARRRSSGTNSDHAPVSPIGVPSLGSRSRSTGTGSAWRSKVVVQIVVRCAPSAVATRCATTRTSSPSTNRSQRTANAASPTPGDGVGRPDHRAEPARDAPQGLGPLGRCCVEVHLHDHERDPVAAAATEQVRARRARPGRTAPARFTTPVAGSRTGSTGPALERRHLVTG